ncbi:FkbM family methyltransferase [Burkholderia ubonensis]|uniref:FkbM family methyltransferase n=1 Tax=Burkholderia ubonensis TaxID=101571 RepID=UPI0007598B66|nr:FkbM family methyltransferase [Burkholderia ubonensis]KVV45445.1 FkbM family methyltransferase [Burkholderia ubonensis]KVW31396.1 FkbM family methyltransferase [Burkholderia ubonensis]
MSFPDRPIAFILAASNHGTMIVNRNDFNVTRSGGVYGVGHQILRQSSFDASEVGFVLALITLRRRYFGDGVFAIDGGANIGVHTIEWARHMHDWGHVLSFEAQEVVYYALAGNIVINNCLNARAKLAALGEHHGHLVIPQPDYFTHASFGSLELRKKETTEYIGQHISYDPSSGVVVPMVSIDSLDLERVDLIKLDVEGMEIEVLRGARKALRNLKPILAIEIIKSDQAVITGLIDELGYRYFPAGMNLIAVHREDPVLRHLSHRDGVTYLAP